jgi:hypothetical protein
METTPTTTLAMIPAQTSQRYQRSAPGSLAYVVVAVDIESS